MSDSKLDPNASPSGLGKSAKLDSGVKKLNKVPLLIVGGVAIILILGLGYATMKRGEIQEGKKVKITKVDGDGEKFANNMLNDLYQQSLRDKMKRAKEKKSEPKKADPKSPAPLPTPRTGTQKNLGPGLSDKNITAEIDKQKLELEKLKMKLYQTAITAPTKIKVGASMNSGTNALGGMGGINPLAMLGAAAGAKPPKSGREIFEMMNALKSAVGGGSKEPNNQDKNFPFLKQKESFDYLNSKKTKQLSPYEIKTGTLIPGVMLSGINSDLPGRIIGQVRENVYDTATGEYLLIPQGTKIIGKYSANVSYGQDRALIIWQRLVFPDGATVNLGAMNGTDQEGYAGFEDQVDHHYFRIFGSALLLTVLNGDITVSNGKLVIKSENTNTQRRETAIEKTASKMIEKQLGIAPTITIRPGYRFNIFVTKDIILEPLNYEAPQMGMIDRDLPSSPNYQSVTGGNAYDRGASYGSNNYGRGKDISPALSPVVPVN
jgi:type IV secretion system protein VirB10